MMVLLAHRLFFGAAPHQRILSYVVAWAATESGLAKQMYKAPCDTCRSVSYKAWLKCAYPGEVLQLSTARKPQSSSCCIPLYYLRKGERRRNGQWGGERRREIEQYKGGRVWCCWWQSIIRAERVDKMQWNDEYSPKEVDAASHTYPKVILHFATYIIAFFRLP